MWFKFVFVFVRFEEKVPKFDSNSEWRKQTPAHCSQFLPPWRRHEFKLGSKPTLSLSPLFQSNSTNLAPFSRLALPHVCSRFSVSHHGAGKCDSPAFASVCSATSDLAEDFVDAVSTWEGDELEAVCLQPSQSDELLRTEETSFNGLKFLRGKKVEKDTKAEVQGGIFCWQSNSPPHKQPTNRAMPHGRLYMVSGVSGGF